MLLPNFLNIMFIPLKPCTFLYAHNNKSICSLYTFVNCLFFYSFEIMLRITCKSEHKPEGVMNRFCQVNSLVVRRFAPNSQRMKSAALICFRLLFVVALLLMNEVLKKSWCSVASISTVPGF